MSADVRALRQVEADRAKPRTIARWVTIITIGVLAVLALTGTYIDPYQTPLGQLLLACCWGATWRCLSGCAGWVSETAATAHWRHRTSGGRRMIATGVQLAILGEMIAGTGLSGLACRLLPVQPHLVTWFPEAARPPAGNTEQATAVRKPFHAPTAESVRDCPGGGTAFVQAYSDAVEMTAATVQLTARHGPKANSLRKGLISVTIARRQALSSAWMTICGASPENPSASDSVRCQPTSTAFSNQNRPILCSRSPRAPTSSTSWTLSLSTPNATWNKP